MGVLRQLALALVFLWLPTLAHAQDCLSGAVTAQETAPGSGVWNYTVTLLYDVTSTAYAPSHFDLILPGLSSCTCACDQDAITFETPAGTSSGTDQITALPCTVQYVGDVICGGSPNFPQIREFTVKWDVPMGATCEPDLAGSGTLSLRSTLPPGAPAFATAAIAFGQGSCSGTVTGTLPECNCPTRVIPGTWGRVKMLYR